MVQGDMLKLRDQQTLLGMHTLHSYLTGDRPKGAGGASALPRKNNSATVSTVMKILSEQKLEVC